MCKRDIHVVTGKSHVFSKILLNIYSTFTCVNLVTLKKLVCLVLKSVCGAVCVFRVFRVFPVYMACIVRLYSVYFPCISAATVVSQIIGTIVYLCVCVPARLATAAPTAQK